MPATAMIITPGTANCCSTMWPNHQRDPNSKTSSHNYRCWFCAGRWRQHWQDKHDQTTPDTTRRRPTTRGLAKRRAHEPMPSARDHGGPPCIVAGVEPASENETRTWCERSHLVWSPTFPKRPSKQLLKQTTRNIGELRPPAWLLEAGRPTCPWDTFPFAQHRPG